jgi:energy-coupling factor transporter ATP-binding protein EcfA2
MTSIATLDRRLETPNEAFFPSPPATIAGTHLPGGLIERLVVNCLQARGEVQGKDIADSLGLRFSVIENLLDDLRARQMLEVKSSLGYGSISSNFTLTETGRKRHGADTGATQYNGPAPVPIQQYRDAVLMQKPRKGWLTRASLARAYEHMEIAPEVLSQIGPAVGSGKSLLIYGQPGNGKTYLAEALAGLSGPDMFIPYAIEHQNAIVRVFDPLLHKPVDTQAEDQSLFSPGRPYDSRWVRCRRPFIVSGGELSSVMLELSYNAETKTLDAPVHLKGNNGIYLIDDFGRQKLTPTELLNRWIVPLESRVDQLSLPFGGKLSVPFEVLLVFSTNLNPWELGDEAFLRRIQYKMLVSDPSREEFRRIFLSFCASKRLDCDGGMLDRFIDKHYAARSTPFRRCHPRDIVSHAIDLIEFEESSHELSENLLDRAFASCFAQQTESASTRDRKTS